MKEMKRAKKCVLISHCILNVNAKVIGYGGYEGALKSLINPLVEEGFGIIQLPCPETTFAGLKRWGMTVEQYDVPAYRKHCRMLLEPFIDQIEDSIVNGVLMAGIIGVEGSPSCGVCETCYGYCGGMIGSGDAVTQSREQIHMGPGQGVFISILQEMLKKRGLDIPMIGVSEKKPGGASWSSIKKTLNIDTPHG